MTKISDKSPFGKDLLLRDDCFILDNGANGKIFVWKGESNFFFYLESMLINKTDLASWCTLMSCDDQEMALIRRRSRWRNRWPINSSSKWSIPGKHRQVWKSRAWAHAATTATYYKFIKPLDYSQILTVSSKSWCASVLQVEILPQGKETILFKQFFKNWN